MAKLLKLRRGTTTQHGSFTGAEGEVTVDTDKETLVVHDGSTAGGHPVAAEDMANVSSASIAGRLGTDSIAVGKIAAGTLPSDVKIADANISGNLTIESADIVDGTIATADIATGAVTGAKLAAGAVSEAGKIANSIITGAKIGSGTIAAGNLATDSVTTVKITDSNVTTAKIADSNVTTAKIADDAVTTAKIADDAVTQAKMADNAIGSSQLANNAVYTAAIQDSAVATAKLANNAATLAKIQDVQSGSILGRQASGAGDLQELGAANIRAMINVEDGATADQTTSEILALINSSNIYTSTGVFGIGASNNIDFTVDNRMGIHINGSEEFRFEADGDFHADGDVYAFSTTISSDENLKKDITIVSDAVTKVEALKGVTFKWKKNDADSAGVIAQDVEKVLPEVVRSVNDPDGNTYKAVNYAGLTSILIEAVKDLSARVKALEAK